MSRKPSRQKSHAQFVGLRKSQTAPINFERKGHLPDKVRPKDYSNFIDHLTLVFREIRLVGDFVISPVEQIKASGADTAGLTLRSRGHAHTFNVAYQPGDNDTRFEWCIAMPPHLVEQAYDKVKNLDDLNALLHQPTLPPQSKGATTMSAVPPLPTVSPSSVSGPTLPQKESRPYTVGLELDPTMGLSDAAALQAALEMVFTQSGLRGQYIVKGGQESVLAVATSDGITWKAPNAGARGLGFFFRDGTKTRCFSLSQQGLESATAEELYEHLVPTAQPTQRPSATINVPQTPLIDQYRSEPGHISRYLTELAKAMQETSVNHCTAHQCAEILNQLLETPIKNNIVGIKVLRPLVDKGYLRIVQTSGPQRLYSFGLKAANLLPESLRGLAPKQQGSQPGSQKTMPRLAAVSLHPAASTTSSTATLDRLQQAKLILQQQMTALAEAESAIKKLIDRRNELIQERQRVFDLLAKLDTELGEIDNQVRAATVAASDLTSKK